MRSLGDLLKTHRVPGVRQAEIRTVCARVASGLTKVPITAKQVKVKDGTAFFSVPSVVKAELHLHVTELKKTLAAAGIEITSVR